MWPFVVSHPDQEMIRPLGLPAVAYTIARSPYFPLALILALIFLVYAPVLNDWFKSDDFFYLRAAQVKAPSQYVIEAFDFRDTSAAADGPGGHYRPLYTISILAEGELFGLHALPYHLVNLLIHLANAALVWLIARKATGRPLIAHIAALVFALHPSYAMVVGWISELSALAATLGALVCLWAFMKALDGGARSRLWYLVSVTSYLAASLYHPKAAPVLVALVAYYLLMHHGSLQDRLTLRAGLRFAPYIAALSLPMLVILWLRGHNLELESSLGYGPHVYRNIMHYLRIAVAPHPLLNSSTPAMVMGTLTSGLVALLAWSAIGAWPLIDVRKRASHLFALFWFLASLGPIATFVWGAFPRQFYNSGPALALVVSIFFVTIIDRLPFPRLSRTAGAAILVVFVVFATQQILDTARSQEIGAAQSRDFIEELRQTYPTLPEETTLYVVGAPFSLRIFGDVYLVKAVNLYYGDIAILSVPEDKAREIELSPQPNERVFRYSGFN